MSLNSFTMSPAPRIAFGENAVDEIGKHGRGPLGKEAAVLVVADPGVP